MSKTKEEIYQEYEELNQERDVLWETVIESRTRLSDAQSAHLCLSVGDREDSFFKDNQDNWLAHRLVRDIQTPEEISSLLKRMLSIDWAGYLASLKVALQPYRNDVESVEIAYIQKSEEAAAICPFVCNRCGGITVGGTACHVAIDEKKVLGDICKCCAQYVLDHYAFDCGLCGSSYLRLPESYHTGAFDVGVCKSCKTQHQKENSRLSANLNRTTKANLPSTLTLSEWLAILDAHDHSCAYCGGDFEAIEHVIPVAQGGGTTSDNCVPTCKSCNSKKHARTPAQADMTTI